MMMRRLAGLLTATLLTAGNAQADRYTSLRDAALSLSDTNPEQVIRAVDAALAEETDEVPAELLIAIAWGESRFNPNEVTGHVCGIMQVDPKDIGLPRSRCALWAVDERLAFRTAVREIQSMLADRRVKWKIGRALLYRACGNSAFTGKCRKLRWPIWVLRRAERLRNHHKKEI